MSGFLAPMSMLMAWRDVDHGLTFGEWTARKSVVAKYVDGRWITTTKVLVVLRWTPKDWRPAESAPR